MSRVYAIKAISSIELFIKNNKDFIFKYGKLLLEMDEIKERERELVKRMDEVRKNFKYFPDNPSIELYVERDEVIIITHELDLSVQDMQFIEDELPVKFFDMQRFNSAVKYVFHWSIDLSDPEFNKLWDLRYK